jgi:hypothetical protein
LNLIKIYYSVCVFSGIVPVFFYFSYKKNSSSPKNKIESFLLLYSVSRFIIDIAVIILSNVIKNSLPAIHISVLICYFLVLKIINEVDVIKNIKLYYLGGVFLFVLDLTITSTIFKPCILSSLTTFFVIIVMSIKALQLFHISRENEKLIGYFLLFYLAAFAYFMYLELMSYSVTIMYWAFLLFISINILFNISISHIIWLRRRI